MEDGSKDFKPASLAPAYAVIIGWFALRMAFLFFHNDFAPDDGYFLNLAESITKGRLTLPLFSSAMRADEYFFALGFIHHFITALLLKIAGSDAWWWITKLPTLAEAAVLLFFLAWWGRKRRFSPAWICLFIAIVAFDPYSWLHAGMLRPDFACLLCSTAALFMIHSCIFDDKPAHAAFAGIFAGAALLSKLEAVSIIPVSGALFLLCSKDVKSCLRNGTIFAAAMLVVTMPAIAWIFSDENRTAILMLQAKMGKTPLYSAIYQRYMNGVPIVVTLKNFAVAHSLRTAWLVISMTTESSYHSAGNLIIFTVLIYTLFHFRNPEDRFWLVIIGVEILLITFASLEIKGQRIFMVLPVAAYKFLSIMRESPRKSLFSALLASLAIFLALRYTTSTGVIEKNSFSLNFGTGAIFVSGAVCLALLVLIPARKWTAASAGKITLACGVAFAAAFTVKGVLAMNATPGVFYPRHLDPLRSELDKDFRGGYHRVVAQPQFYILFPRNCDVFSSNMFTLRMNYRYWLSYYDFYSEVNADAIVITGEEKKSWDRDKFARKYLNDNYFLEKNFRALDENFLLYRNRYSLKK